MGTWSWLGFGLAAGLCAVEGFEAFMLVTAGALKGGWRKAFLAALAGMLALAPLGGGLYFAFKYINASYIDYGIAVFIFALGIHEVMEGRGAKPKRQGRPQWAKLEGPLGIDPADDSSIKHFQSQHGLEADGIIGPRTRGAILTALEEQNGSGPSAAAARRNGSGRNRIGVDITDEESIRRYQRSRDLPADGVIGPLTRGALAADATRVLLDPSDPETVRGFQRTHGLAESGVVDKPTQAALRALRSAHGRRDVERLIEPEVSDPESIKRFQRQQALPATGTIDAQTQGAIRAERAWQRVTAGLDPAKPESIRHFQNRAGLDEDGVIGPRTQSAMREAREQLDGRASRNGSPLTLDPAYPESVKRFQRRHGLPETGQVDEETRQDIVRELELTGGLDITDPSAIAAFQRSHGLEPTGMIAQPTQGALRARQAELLQGEGDEKGEARKPQRAQDNGVPAWLPLDATDPESIVSFQREHGLQADGVIGADTQAALRSLLSELMENPPERRGGGGLQGFLGDWFDVWPAFLGFAAEGFETLLFGFSVAHGRGTPISAAGGAFFGFFFTWPVMVNLRGWIDSKPEWKVNTVIGLTLISVATIFGLLHAFGILHS